MPKFKDVPEHQRAELFRTKLKLSRKCFNFKDHNEDTDMKELKKNVLLELVDYLEANSDMYSKANLNELMKTVRANIFRTLGRGSPLKSQTLDPDEEELNLEEAWPHYQIVYELLLKFIMTPQIEPVDIREALNSDFFIVKLLELFESEDPRE